MPKFIHTADLHIGKSRGFPGYRERQGQMLTEIFAAAREYADSLVLIAGDVYDTATLLPRERDLFYDHLCRADKAGITTVIINGNHDMIDEDDGGYTNLRAIKVMAETKRLRRTYVVESDPSVIDLEAFDIAVLAVPAYYRKGGEVNEVVSNLLEASRGLKRKYTVALVHETILGARNDQGKRLGVDKGIGNPNHYASLDGSIPVTYWALGDIHRPQQIKGCKNAWYCGTPMQHDFSDTEERGVLLVDLDDPENPGLLELEGIKKLLTVKVDSATTKEDLTKFEDRYLRLVGDSPDLRRLRDSDHVVATKIAKPEAGTVKKIEDATTDDILGGLPIILAEMNLSEEDIQWCTAEVERLK